MKKTVFATAVLVTVLFTGHSATAEVVCCPPQEKGSKCAAEVQCQPKDPCSPCPQGWERKNKWWKIW